MFKKINILSWNVSWGCMSGNNDGLKDRTAYALAKYCKELRDKDPSNGNPCLNNVADFIDKSNPYDFVGLQECKNWKNIMRKSNFLKKMGYINHIIEGREGVHVDLTTFYDKKIYKVLAVKVGNLIASNFDARPYHIIFLSDVYNNYYIFINLHNGHGSNYDKNNLERSLSFELENGIDVSKSKNKNFCNIKNKSDISEIINGKYFKVIIVGDFNDHGSHNFWKGIKPFRYTKFTNLQNITVKSYKKPPKTCCIGGYNIRKTHSDVLYGDYILLNKNDFNIIDLNYIPIEFNMDAYVYPTSDHIPIKASFYNR